LAGAAESASRDAEDVESIGEMLRELVEYMRRVAETREEKQGRSTGAPVEYFERDARAHNPARMVTAECIASRADGLPTNLTATRFENHPDAPCCRWTT